MLSEDLVGPGQLPRPDPLHELPDLFRLEEHGEVLVPVDIAGIHQLIDWDPIEDYEVAAVILRQETPPEIVAVADDTAHILARFRDCNPIWSVQKREDVHH